MRALQKIMLVAFMLSFLILSCKTNPVGSAQNVQNGGIEEARTKLQEAFNATVFAEVIGTDINETVKNLNTALDYIHQAETLTAQRKLDQAAAMTQASIRLSEETTTKINEMRVQQGLVNFYVKTVLPIVLGAVVLCIAVYAILYSRRVWKKRQEKKPLETKAESDNLNRETDDEKIIVVAVLSALIVVAGLLVIVSLTPAPQQNFVSFYILNSEKNADYYPSLMILGKNNSYTFWIGVENFMSRIEYVVVKVNVANGSQNEKTAFTFERVLFNQEKWEIPLPAAFNQTGVYRITSNLGLYDEMRAVFTVERLVNLSPLKVVSAP